MSKTIEEIDRALIAEWPLGSQDGMMRDRGYGSVCVYNPYLPDDPKRDCGKPGAWHACLRSEGDSAAMTIACHEHLGIFLHYYRPALIDFHEFGIACGRKDSWYIFDKNACLLEHEARMLGYTT